MDCRLQGRATGFFAQQLGLDVDADAGQPQQPARPYQGSGP
jgi:hypothetical protein